MSVLQAADFNNTRLDQPNRFPLYYTSQAITWWYKMAASMEDFIKTIPKAELHVHIEGTFEPELMFRIAKRNGIALEGTVESHKEKRENFKDLQDFLDVYYKACDVLRTEEDFHDLMYAYLQRASADSVYYVEIFFDPQTHTERGVSFDTVINGLYSAIVKGQKLLSIKARLIMCFLRHESEAAALATLEQAKPHIAKILGVGLDSGERDNPPSKFSNVFQQARKLGLRLVAHAGEEMGADYICEALDILQVERIDHGIQCLQDSALVGRLVRDSVPLTVCPLSNWKLNVNRRFTGDQNKTRVLLHKGLMVTINSDDPAYFGGYIGANFTRTVEDTDMNRAEIFQVCQNAFQASFLPPQDKELYLEQLEHFGVEMGMRPAPKSVVIFGGHSPQSGSAEYKFAYDIGNVFASAGYTIINGGYCGTMEAASHGARGAGGSSLGVIAPRVFTVRSDSDFGNQYLSEVAHATCPANRTGKMLQLAQHVLVLPGSIGTMGEFMHTWYYATAVQIRGAHAPKIFLARQPWQKIVEELAVHLRVREQYKGSESEMAFFDSPEEALQLVEKDRRERLKQNS